MRNGSRTRTNSACVDAALQYAKFGWTVFPASIADKRPHKAGKNSNGRRWGATKIEAEIKRDFKKWPDAAVCIPTGIENGIFVVEADTAEGHDVDGIANLQALIDANSPLPETRMARSPSGSLHYYFSYPNEGFVRNSASKLAPGVDVRGEGGMVVASPSVKPGVGEYKWLNKAGFKQAPQWLIDLVIDKEGDRTPGVLQSDPEKVAKALEIIPNNDADWENWNRVGMAAYLATCGHETAFKAFDAWSRKSSKYNEKITHERWYKKYRSSPPTEIGAGTLFRMANDEQPGWMLIWNEEHSDGGSDDAVAPGGVTLDCFVAYMPLHSYIYIPTREPWPGSSVNSRIPPMPLFNPDGTPQLDKKGDPKFIPANAWLDKNQPVEQMTWAPGLPMKIYDRLVADGGWFERKGVTCFNLYRPPTIIPGDATDVKPWLDHVRKVYPTDADHILNWLAQRVQFPHEKINHSLVFGGQQGIGKDTILEPVKRAIGPWNFAETTPGVMMGRFNGFLKSVILRINEARDLGEVTRFQFYEHTKPYMAAPPDVHRVDEKNLREHSVFNVCGVIITTNYKTDGIYLPADDRRHYVAWSDLTKEDFTESYWNELWGWYNNDGDRNVAAYLATRDISSFNAKAPPLKTEAFWAIVNSNRAPEEGELADVFDELENPDAVTIERITDCAVRYTAFYDWITDRKNRRAIPHRLEKCGYVPVRNDTSKDGLWIVVKKRQVVYAKSTLSISEQINAVTALQKQAEIDAKEEQDVWSKHGAEPNQHGPKQGPKQRR
jgi:hypothetical protein